MRPGGLLVLDSSGCSERLLAKAKFDTDPRTDGTLAAYEVLEIDLAAEALAAVSALGLTRTQSLRSKNMWALGLALWLFGRPLEPVEQAIEARFGAQETVRDANFAALRAGHAYGEIHELATSVGTYDVGPAKLLPGLYRSVSGAEALGLGIVSGSKLAGLPLYFASYPITPASPVLHRLASIEDPEITTVSRPRMKSPLSVRRSAPPMAVRLG